MARNNRKADARKQSLYFPEEVLKEIYYEARRLDRSLSWVVQQAWFGARERIQSLPTARLEMDDE